VKDAESSLIGVTLRDRSLQTPTPSQLRTESSLQKCRMAIRDSTSGSSPLMDLATESIRRSARPSSTGISEQACRLKIRPISGYERRMRAS